MFKFTELFAQHKDILTNPLCRSIFEARLRCFSDYAEPSDPLNKEIADDIIQQLNKAKDPEARVAIFFDFFTQYRPIPASQAYIVEINIEDKVQEQLTAYCLAKIEAIQTKDDYLKVKQLIQKLKTQGGDQAVFDAIKYNVASAIEEEDMCSSRSYKAHMEAILTALSTPQLELSDCTEELQKSPGYRAMVTANMQGHGFLMPPANPLLTDAAAMAQRNAAPHRH